MTSTPKPSPYADLVNQQHGHEYCCTRARGHDGPHVAGAATAPVRTIVAVWE